MDEIHANLQHEGNKICPAAIVHEGYEEDFVKRKKLKNIHYFADSELTYEELWEVIFDYVDKRYDIPSLPIKVAINSEFRKQFKDRWVNDRRYYMMQQLLKRET